MQPPMIYGEAELDELLSRPSPEVVEALSSIDVAAAAVKCAQPMQPARDLPARSLFHRDRLQAAHFAQRRCDS